MFHIPVLLHEVINVLEPKPGEFFIDGTVGSGGHAEEIIKYLHPNGMFLGIDWDKSAIQRVKLRIKNYELRKLIVLNDNYARLPEILRERNLPKADGLLLDLGFSSEQIGDSGRGFTFLKNEPLDMRYNTTGEIKNQISKIKMKIQNSKTTQTQNSLTAEAVINTWSRGEVKKILEDYGEERFAANIAEIIFRTRKKEPIKTTFQLVEIIKKAIPRNFWPRRIHLATKTFQAIRIFVNNELDNLKTVLEHLFEILNPKGRIAVISFHSLEDRIVKQLFQKFIKENKALTITKKPIIPTREEIKNNPRSRTAKLRGLSI